MARIIWTAKERTDVWKQVDFQLRRELINLDEGGVRFVLKNAGQSCLSAERRRKHFSEKEIAEMVQKVGWIRSRDEGLSRSAKEKANAVYEVDGYGPVPVSDLIANYRPEVNPRVHTLRQEVEIQVYGPMTV